MLDGPNMTIFSRRNVHLVAAAILIPVAIFNLASAWEYGITPAALGLIFSLCAIYSLLVGIGQKNPEQKLPLSLQRVTRFYVILLGVLYVVAVPLSLFMERVAFDLELVIIVIMFGALSVAAWGTAFFVVIVLPAWAIYSSVRRLAKKRALE